MIAEVLPTLPRPEEPAANRAEPRPDGFQGGFADLLLALAGSEPASPAVDAAAEAELAAESAETLEAPIVDLPIPDTSIAEEVIDAVQPELVDASMLPTDTPEPTPELLDASLRLEAELPPPDVDGVLVQVSVPVAEPVDTPIAALPAATMLALRDAPIPATIDVVTPEARVAPVPIELTGDAAETTRALDVRTVAPPTEPVPAPTPTPSVELPLPRTPAVEAEARTPYAAGAEASIQQHTASASDLAIEEGTRAAVRNLAAPSPDAPNTASPVTAMASVDGALAAMREIDAPSPLAPRPMQSAQAAQAIAQRVHVLASEGGGVARIRLSPPELGQVELSVRVHGNSVDVAIKVEEVVTQFAATQARVQLSEGLAIRDLRIENFEVSTFSERSTGDADPRSGGSGTRDNDRGNAAHRYGSHADAHASDEMNSLRPPVSANRVVDLRV